MRTAFLYAVIAGLLRSTEANAGELVGPGRFCGYSPIIDLQAREKVVTFQGGIHGGSFQWEGPFGVLEVHGVGWASRPPGRMKNGYSVAIWNGAQGAAYFESARPITREQLPAIDRVALFQEGQTPSGCKLRTIFSWE